MIQTVPDILARIVEHKRAELAAVSSDLRSGWVQSAGARSEHRDFRGALTARQPAIIAEIKKASPSKGVLCEQFDPASIARLYAEGGASALSVLTDARFFQGSSADLERTREAVSLPVLRKDFTIHEDQVLEAAAFGADAILLIAAILTREEMRHLRSVAARFGMAALTEVHDEAELEEALASGADIIGVNNRNLRTFEVTLDTSLRLARQIPESAIRVAESGIHSRRDIELLRAAGFQAFLVGEHLMLASDPVAALRVLTQ